MTHESRDVVGTVGVAGFEPTAPRSQSGCATKLRHTPWRPESRCAVEATAGRLTRPVIANA